MYPIQGVPIGYQQLTTITAAVGLTIPAGAKSALIAATTQGVRFRTDADPTGTVGFPIPANATIYWVGNLSTLKFIQMTGGAVLDVLYFG